MHHEKGCYANIRYLYSAYSWHCWSGPLWSVTVCSRVRFPEWKMGFPRSTFGSADHFPFVLSCLVFNKSRDIFSQWLPIKGGHWSCFESLHHFEISNRIWSLPQHAIWVATRCLGVHPKEIMGKWCISDTTYHDPQWICNYYSTLS